MANQRIERATNRKCHEPPGSGHFRFVLFGVAALFAGCYSCPVDPGPKVVQEVAKRTLEAVPAAPPAKGEIPPGINLSDGLDENEAVGIALWNNPDFQALLVNLGLAQADIIQAGLLTNPDVAAFFPVGPKIFELTATIPLEALVLRPHREAVAHTDYQRIAQELEQNGLDLVRNVRQAFVDLRFANDRAMLASQAVDLRKSILDLSEKRFEDGDISEAEVIPARTEYHTAKAELGNLKQNVLIARNTLLRLMGVSHCGVDFGITPSGPTALACEDVETLQKEAFVIRPDVRAARFAIDNARERLELAQKAWLRFAGVIDVNSPGRRAFEIGPGLMFFSLPIFDWNQAGVSRAQSRLEQSERDLRTRHEQITLEVRNSLAQFRQARDNVQILQNEVLPALQEAVGLAEKAFERGGTTYLFVLQVSTQYLQARARELELLRDQRRARAELERSVGRRLREHALPSAVPIHEIPHPNR